MTTQTADAVTLPVQKQKFGSSMFVETVQRMWRSPGGKVGTVLLLVIVLSAVLAPVIAPYGVNQMDLTHLFAPPSRQHWFGTDALGRDLLTRILYGGQYSLSLGLAASLLSCVVGAFIGSFAGYFGGRTETLIMRAIDVWSSIPSLLLCIMVSAAFGAGFFNTVIALAVGEVPIFVRLIRGQILRERSAEYLEAAESINCSRMSIMFRHLLPNVVSPLIVQLTMGVGTMITMAASLSFIGLGVQPPTPEWGALLADGRSHILNFPYLIMFPGLVIALTVLSINLMGDALRDALDPKLRA
ncbi:MAG: ABC transporter permease [Propionicimonas sp.]|uniref:ABC transporter permease n=1 Tax=Propionicimonas sp. TaxID=1955623 RepID=UPI003D105B96